MNDELIPPIAPPSEPEPDSPAEFAPDPDSAPSFMPAQAPTPDVPAASMVEAVAPSALPTRSGSPLPVWVILLILFAGLIIVAAILGTYLNTRNQGSSSGAESLSVGKLSTFLSPPTIPPEMVILQQNNAALPATLPLMLDVGGQTLPIVAVTPEEGRWPIPEDGQSAVWVYGTVINYVIGVPYTEALVDALAELDSSAHITLTLNNGSLLIFGAPQMQRVPIDDVSPMAQTQPGLTLVQLSSSGSDRLTIRARYLPEETQTAGGPQRVRSLSVEVLEAYRLDNFSAPEMQYFVVDYQVMNESAQEVDPALFDLVLQDGAGNHYLLNPEATGLGAYAPPPASIAAQETVQLSVGYLVPSDLRPPLTWTFRPDPTAATLARFPLFYQPPLPGPAQPQVELTGAFIDNTRGVIVINGVIRNVGESNLTITGGDVSLTSSGGELNLRAATPLLPWTVAAGDEQRFELQFTRPDEGIQSVLLDVDGFTFQIEGLP